MDKLIFEMLKELQPTFEFEDGVNFIESGYLDSFDIVQLVAELELQFKIVVSALDIVPENFCSVQAIRLLVEKSTKRI
ncbi:phosphopantetheine-binding protein [uncultured Desulfovibrio sp.]|uniref:phosphopantetheine-binding protein n=1 Tax=uncultured Desulfovibrio sp. TaxID=167968 RepID=UPI00261086CF|nr:phosphopantetheine-binding protein [uncultured Desulfovibrio sp.]